MKQKRKSKNYGAISRSITYIVRKPEGKREGSIRNIYSDNEWPRHFQIHDRH